MNKILVLGGGVAGSSCAHFLKEKGYEIEIIEALPNVGGLARTYTYAGHPYEFGPHIWFWPDGLNSPINKAIHDLADGEVYYIDRKLLSFIEQDGQTYRYPVHLEDVQQMAGNEQIMSELKAHRNEDFSLKADEMPVIGECKFEDYFSEALGPTIYNKFMHNYSWKMWDIPGDKLETSMVWADRLADTFDKTKKSGLSGYDPLKKEAFNLGGDIKYQVYPKKGWADIWDKMVVDAKIVNDRVVKIIDGDNPKIELASGEFRFFSDYELVVNTLDIDMIWGMDILPYTGRIMLPLVLPSQAFAFPDMTESMHFSGAEFMTRVTEMKIITRHESDDTLLLIEVPIVGGTERSFPENTLEFAKANNLYARKAYPQQSKEAFASYDKLVAQGAHIKNLVHCGRHAQFKYWGMAETVNSAFALSEKL